MGPAQGQDITGRKQTEEKLRETRDYLESLIDYANAPIIVWDLAFKIARFNNAFERLDGYEASDVVSKELQVLFPEESREESLRRIEQTLAGEHWESVEIPIRCKDGATRLVLWNSANVHAGNEKNSILEWRFGKNKGYGLYPVKEILAVAGMTIKETGEAERGARADMNA